VPELFTFDYAIIRVVPRVEREEFLNAGAVLFCPTQDFLKARIELDLSRLTAFAPELDGAAVEAYLNTIPCICDGVEAGPAGQMTQRARFHWLVAPRSTIIQLSPVHSGVCHHLDFALERLIEKMVRVPAA
jgi:hypothetical protein